MNYSTNVDFMIVVFLLCNQPCQNNGRMNSINPMPLKLRQKNWNNVQFCT